MNKQWLITIDLDGTLLKDGESGVGNYDFHENNKKTIKKLTDLGHKVSIITGRPWYESKEIYEKLELTSIIANYNGCHIHNPTDKGFQEITYSINRELVRDILNDSLVMRITKSVIMETPEKTYVNGDLTNNIFVHSSKRDGFENWDIKKMLPINPRAILVNLKFEEFDPYEVISHLKRYYGNSMFFRLWKGTTSGEDWVQMEINQKTSNKGTAMEHIAAYYNIPMSNTISFGDGLNDREMLEKASIGVSMKNAKGTVKTYSNDTTNFDNNEAGVSEYLEKFFNLK